jgi:hypothetical protein
MTGMRDSLFSGTRKRSKTADYYNYRNKPCQLVLSQEEVAEDS